MGHAELASAANDCRRSGQMREAQILFEQAARKLPEVEGLERANVLALWASLDRDLMDYRAAEAKLDRATHIYRLHRRTRDIARCEIIRGIVLDDRGDHEAAQEEFAQAWHRLPEDDSLRGVAAYNLVESEIAMGRAEEARAMFESLRPEARMMARNGDPLRHLRRLDWIEAQIMLGEGRTVEAREALLRLVEEYAGQMNLLNAGRLQVDLAECASRLDLPEAFEAASLTFARLLSAAGVGQAGLALSLILARMTHRRCSEAVVRMLLQARRSGARA